MDKEIYNSCMKEAMTGLSVSRDERNLLFCMNAKICSGKAADEAEAARLCSAPKLPKWATRLIDDADADLSCAERTGQTLADIDTLALKFKTGDMDGVAPIAAGILNNCMACGYPGDFNDISSAMGEAREMSGRFYMVGEARDLTKKLNAIKDKLNQS